MTQPTNTIKKDDRKKGKGGPNIDLKVRGEKLAPTVEIWAFDWGKPISNSEFTLFLAKEGDSRWKQLAKTLTTDSAGHIKQVEIKGLTEDQLKDVTGISVMYAGHVVTTALSEPLKDKVPKADYWFSAPRLMAERTYCLRINADSVILANQPVSAKIVAGKNLGTAQEIPVELGVAEGVTVQFTVPSGLTDVLIVRKKDGAQHRVQL